MAQRASISPVRAAARQPGGGRGLDQQGDSSMVEKDKMQGRSTGTVIISGGANTVHNTIDAAYVAAWPPHWAGMEQLDVLPTQGKQKLIDIGIFTPTFFSVL
jgi:hypothetical protein